MQVVGYSSIGGFLIVGSRLTWQCCSAHAHIWWCCPAQLTLLAKKSIYGACSGSRDHCSITWSRITHIWSCWSLHWVHLITWSGTWSHWPAVCVNYTAMSVTCTQLHTPCHPSPTTVYSFSSMYQKLRNSEILFWRILSQNPWNPMFLRTLNTINVLISFGKLRMCRKINLIMIMNWWTDWNIHLILW